jgi:hypothetical protein
LPDARTSADGISEVGEGRLAAAGEPVEIERDCLHAIVGLGIFQRDREIAQAILLGRASACDNFGDIGPGRLFDDGSVEVERKHALTDRGRLYRERSVERAEKQKHEDQDERVLDSDQQSPDCPGEAHPNESPS